MEGRSAPLAPAVVVPPASMAIRLDTLGNASETLPMLALILEKLGHDSDGCARDIALVAPVSRAMRDAAVVAMEAVHSPPVKAALSAKAEAQFQKWMKWEANGYLVRVIHEGGEMTFEQLIYKVEGLVVSGEEAKRKFMEKVKSIAETRTVDEAGKSVTYITKVNTKNMKKYGLKPKQETAEKKRKIFRPQGPYKAPKPVPHLDKWGKPCTPKLENGFHAAVEAWKSAGGKNQDRADDG